MPEPLRRPHLSTGIEREPSDPAEAASPARLRLRYSKYSCGKNVGRAAAVARASVRTAGNLAASGAVVGFEPDRPRQMPYHIAMPELVFEVVQESDGGYCAECLTESIVTEGDTWDELRKNALEATSAFFFDRDRPERIRLRLVRDEVVLGA